MKKLKRSRADDIRELRRLVLLQGMSVGGAVQESGSDDEDVEVLIRINHASPDTVLAVNDVAMIDVTDGALPTITAPPGPTDGKHFYVVWAGGSLAAYPAVITANIGEPLEDPSAPLTFRADFVTIDGPSPSLDWMWDDVNSWWKLR